MGRLNRDELTRMAKSMKDEIAERGENGKAERFPQPFYVQLLARKGSLTLLVGRRDTWPLLEDAIQIARAFGVPGEDLEGEYKTQWFSTRLGGPQFQAKAVGFSWREELAVEQPVSHQQLTFFGAAEAANALRAGL